MVWAFFAQQWSGLFSSALTLFLSYLPKLFEQRSKITLPMEFIIIIVLFSYGSLFLGEAFDFYERFWWWDILLHTTSAVVFGCIGFIILHTLVKGNKVQAHPIWIAIFSFCFAMAIGAIWEIFEFTMDEFLGLNMQKTGLVDTMWDLIVDSLGALIASAGGYAYLKNKKLSFAGRLIKHFFQKNSSLTN